MAYVFNLPTPPSVNALYGTNFKTKRRFKSEAYETWLKVAGPELARQAQNIKPIHVPVKVLYEFQRTRKGSDLFNREKATSDLLVMGAIIQDDSQIHEGTVKWNNNITGVRITVEELP